MKIITIANRGGYSHNDIHPKNIMVTKVESPTFQLGKRNIDHCGVQLIAIDYGEVVHEKFLPYLPKKDYRQEFAERPADWTFNETFWATFTTIDGFVQLMEDCKEKGKKLPWEGKVNTFDLAMVKLMRSKKYMIWFDQTAAIYCKLFPGGEKLFWHIVEKVRDGYDGKISDLMKGKNNSGGKIHCWRIIHRIVDEFTMYDLPTKTKWWGWYSEVDYGLPHADVRALMRANNVKNYIQTLLAIYDKNG